MMNHENTISTSMVDNSSYQSVLKISDRMIEIYDTELSILCNLFTPMINVLNVYIRCEKLL